MKKVSFKIISLLFISLFVFYACNKTKKLDQKQVRTADSLFNSNNYLDAKKAYDDLLKLNPENLYLKKKLNQVDSLINLEEENKQYNQVLNIADSLFNNQNYEDAINVYRSAIEHNPNDTYPLNRIAEIEAILHPVQKQISGPYHIVVGCFAVPSNAERLFNKLQNEGHNTQMMPLRNSSLQAVSYSSYNNIHEAYNNLDRARNVNYDAWVMRLEY